MFCVILFVHPFVFKTTTCLCVCVAEIVMYKPNGMRVWKKVCVYVFVFVYMVKFRLAGWLGVGCCYIFIAVSVYITLLLLPDLLSIPWESPSRSFWCCSLCFLSFFLSCSFVLALSFLLVLPLRCCLSPSLFSHLVVSFFIMSFNERMILCSWFYTSNTLLFFTPLFIWPF